ncbi:transporter substrate-binding protein [Agrobacterium albertimagni]|nr:transporter substrate-binding protein [Agrobacterium albertimagni]
MTRETAPIPILYSTTLPYASLGREAVDGTLAAASEANASTDDPFRLEPKIAAPRGRAEQYASLADAAIRQQGWRHVIGKITSWSRKDVLPVMERHGSARSCFEERPQFAQSQILMHYNASEFDFDAPYYITLRKR